MTINLIRASNGSGEAVRSVVTSPRTIGSTTLNVDSLTNYNTEFICTSGDLLADGTLDPATVTVFYGTKNVSQIIIDGFAPGYSDLGNTVGQVVVCKPTTAWADNVADTLAVTLNDDGTLKTDIVTTAKIADDNVTAAKIDWASTGANAGIWWEELGRTTLGSAGDAISVASLPARKYLMVIASCLATGGTIRPLVRFNNDTASNYANRHSVSGAADSTNVSQSAANTTLTATAQLHNVVLNVVNIAAQEKTVTETIVSQGTSGAGNAPIRIEGTFKWANTADQITRVDLVNDGTGDFATGSEVLVLGHN